MTAADLPNQTAPIIVTALFGQQDQAWFDSLRRAHFPPERNHLAAHLTMFHHLSPLLEAELRQRLVSETRRVLAPAAKVTGLMSLGGGTAFRIESPRLDEIRARLADAFAPMPIRQDAARWRAHVTIQNKVSPAEARALHNALNADFCPRSVAIAGLGTWWYRGGPWEPLSRHMFG